MKKWDVFINLIAKGMINDFVGIPSLNVKKSIEWGVKSTA
jgi:hypothetical protein